MNLSDEQKAFALDVSKLIQFIYQSKHSCTLGEAFRTVEQAAIYASQHRGIQDSLHCSRLAIDLNIFNPDGVYLTDSEYYEPFGVFWESLTLKNRWGGRFYKMKDGNHFERRLQ